MNISLPENFKPVAATAGPVTSNGGVTGDYVSLKNAHMAWILVTFDQAVGHATLVTPKQASAVAGTGVKALTTAVPIWANEDVAASDTLVAQTAALNYTVTNDIKVKQVLFQIDPAGLDLANDFDCIGLAIADSSQATNFVDATYFLQTRYAQATPPAAITD